jgi:hypothetical protein
MRDERLIAEEIAELARPWQGSLLHFSGPVSADEVAWAEQELGVTFPPSYRAFVRHYGSGRILHYRLLGVHSDSLWGDVVAVNHLAFPRLPRHLIRVAETLDEHSFHLDTSQRDEDGECQVLAYGPGASGRVVADSFLEFLRRVCAGLEGPRTRAAAREPVAQTNGTPQR